MTFPIFQFLTPPPAAANPNAAVANGIRGIGQGMEKVQTDRRIKDQEDQFAQSFGLHANEQLLKGQAMAHNEDEDAAGMVLQYNKFLAAGDDASAQALAPAMKAMGIELVPRPGAPGLSAEDWHAQVQQPQEAADVPLGDVPQEAPAQPQSKAPSAIPPLLSKFMSAAPQAQPQAEAPIDERAASAERVRSIGGQPAAVEEPAAAPRAAAAPETTTIGKPAYEVMYRGKSMGTIDPNAFREQHKAEATRRGQAFVDSLPEAAANQIFPGLNDAATGPEQKDTIENDMRLILQQMRSAASRGKGGAGTGLEGLLADPKEAARLDNEVRQWTQAVATDNSLKKLNEVATEAAKSATLLNPDEPLANRLAVAQTIKSMFGAAASEGERAFILGGEGVMTKLQMDLNNWVSGGTLPANFKTALQGISNRAHLAANARARFLSENGANSILENPLVGGRIPDGMKPKVKQAIMTTLSAETGMAPAPSTKKPSVYQ